MDFFETGVVAGRKAAWHGKAIRPEGKEILTAAEMCALVPELASDIDQRRVAYEGADGQWHVIDDRVANVRVLDETMIGMVGKNWKAIPPKRLFRFGDDVVASGEAKYESAFTMKGGSEVCILMQRPRDILIGGHEQERMKRYIAMICGYDTWGQARSLQVFPTDVRCECWNTVQMALRGMGTFFSIPHTGDLEGKIELARRTLDITFKHDEAFEAVANDMARTPFSKRDLRDVLDKLTIFQPPKPEKDTVRKQENRELAKGAIIDYFTMAPNLTETPTAGTKWAAYNAVCEYSDWDRPVQTKKDPMARFRRITKDTAMKDETFRLLMPQVAV